MQLIGTFCILLSRVSDESVRARSCVRTTSASCVGSSDPAVRAPQRAHRSARTAPSLRLRPVAMESHCSEDLAEPWPDWSAFEPMVAGEHVEPRRDRDRTQYVARKAGVARRPRLVDSEDASGDPVVARPGNGSSHSKRARAALFAQWIVDNLPLPPIEQIRSWLRQRQRRLL